MVKILMGVVAAIVIAAGGYFGFELYVQHQVAGEVEAAFEQIRATGAKASHGKVSFDRSTRTLTVADISGESAAQPPVSLKIASFTASGVGQPDKTRFSPIVSKSPMSRSAQARPPRRTGRSPTRCRRSW